MPFDYLPFEPPVRSSIRERALKQVLNRVDAVREARSISLKAASERGLSPDLLRVNAEELDSFNRVSAKLRNDIEIVKQQDAAETAYENSLKPLARNRDREGFYRSGKTRAEAIAGILERERRKSSPLSRENFLRAKAIAAASLYSRTQDWRLKNIASLSGVSYTPRLADVQSLDPCYDAKRVRRQSMFAKGLLGRGYRSPKIGRPC